MSDVQPKALFARAEVQAERTVSVLRMAIALALVLVFFAVLREAPAGEPMLVRQWLSAGATMSAYFLLGAASFLAIRRGLYRPWMAWIAVTGDCLFPLVNIWLGLANTGLPTGFLIILPPVWLAPVVLAFGALRFNPWLQGYVLLLLVGGLAGLAYLEAPMGGEASPALIAKFTSFSPNVIRLCMLALAAGVLLVAALRARSLLRGAIAETYRRINLTRYLPAEVAERLAQGGLKELTGGRRQTVAVLFVDLRGFTRRAEGMSPEEVGAFVTEFRRRVRRAAEASGGTIDKFIGDAAMIVFGLLKEEGPPNARGALACADRILLEMADWNRGEASSEPVAVSVGLHWGPAFCGAVGDQSRLEFTVLGDTVNIAARLQEYAKCEGVSVVVSAATLQAAERVPGRHWRELPEVTLRGRRDGVRAFATAEPLDGAPARESEARQSAD
ncbi:hypothetical protein CKO21_01405 [Rhodovibrio salinarum]|uniref:Guanylate cyclase domain-containing protein n=1 Tax=Rhodovibrio salinarum TaxID=1087 RepID=A0A934QF01_9PROT|nr:hypothetical protein [Rhodovibrio salinarum]